MTKKEHRDQETYDKYVTACIEKERLETEVHPKIWDGSLYKDQDKIIVVMKKQRSQIKSFKKRKAEFRERARRSMEEANRLISTAVAFERQAEFYANAIREKKKSIADENMLGLLNENMLLDLREDISPESVASLF